jgi:hypothetical protein
MAPLDYRKNVTVLLGKIAFTDSVEVGFNSIHVLFAFDCMRANLTDSYIVNLLW